MSTMHALTPAPVAPVVTEHTWERVDNAAAIARTHKGSEPPEAIITVCTYRIAHRDPSCSRIKVSHGTVVGTDVDTSTSAAGTLCDYCWPSYDGTPVVADPAAEESTTRRGTGPNAAETRAMQPGAGEPSDKQAGYYRHLVAVVTVLRSGEAVTVETLARPDVEASVEAAVETMKRKGTWTRLGLSAAITRGEAAVRDLGHDPRARVQRDTTVRVIEGPVPFVPAGHYAIESTGSNDLAFYRVDRPTKGEYVGRVFVKLVVGGHADRNVRRDQVASILARITADPDAGPRYGREIGRCCRCNRHLTDEDSRRLGIGPECRKKV